VTQVFAELPDDEGEPEPEAAPPADTEPPVVAAPPVEASPAEASPSVAARRVRASPAVAVAQPRVAGYWVHSHGQWYYYPLPPDARPGQQLVPTHTRPGTPGYVVGGYRYHGYRPGYRVVPGTATHVHVHW